ncbi:hypothetical protein D3C81_2034330 [compost metagenome]
MVLAVLSRRQAGFFFELADEIRRIQVPHLPDDFLEGRTGILQKPDYLIHPALPDVL